MTEPLHIVLASSLPERDPAIARWVTSGRGSLAWILGDEDCRYRLLAQAINWDRVLVAYRNGAPLGYAAFKQQRRGPFSPGIRPFINEFGLLRGALRHAFFVISECREWFYGFYLYGLRVRKVARRQGVASALLQATCERARDSGHRTIELEVQAKNVGARALYARHDFTPRSSLPARLSRLLPIPTVLNLRRRLPPSP